MSPVSGFEKMEMILFEIREEFKKSVFSVPKRRRKFEGNDDEKKRKRRSKVGRVFERVTTQIRRR